MKRTHTLMALAAITCTSQAATVTPILNVNFSGSIVGNTYTLGAGEVDTTGTFTGFGSPIITGGEADLVGGASNQGFTMSHGVAAGVTTNWIAETILNFDTFSALDGAISVDGGLDFRVTNAATQLEALYWDGAVDSKSFSSLPTAGTEVHLALVWDATANNLTAFIDGVAAPAVGGNAYSVNGDYVSFGYFGRSGFDNRGMDGQLNAVAFSTYTGSVTAADLQLTVPEPSSAALLGLGGLALILRRRK